MHRLSPMRTLVALTLLIATPALSFAQEAKVDPLDWPHWRGPEQNGISREKGLVDRWSPDGENLLWESKELGTRSTPIVMRGKLYTLARSEPGTPIEGEKVMCADAATGKVLWENKFNVFLSDVPDTRIAWSNVVGDPTTGRVYALGVCGLFQCIDGDSGKTIWQHSLSEKYGMLTTYGGRTNVPILVDDQVIISGVCTGWGDYAKPDHRFLAFDKTDGTPVWNAGTRPLPDDTTYSTPILGVFNGQLAMVFAAGDGAVYAMQPRTGKILWKYQLSIRGVNSTPLIDGNTVYIGQSEENPDDNSMGALVALNGAGSGDLSKSPENVLWRVKERMIGRCAPVLIDGRLYAGDDGGALYAIDAKTGKMIGKQKVGTMMRSSMLYADGKIYTAEANGRWVILQPTEKGLKVIHRLRLPGEIHGTPIVSHGRIYIPTVEAMYCIGKKDAEPTADPRPEVPQETPASEDQTPAQVQVVPVEALIKPGEKQQYEVRLYNAKGQFLKTDKAEFSAAGSGEIDDNGQFSAPSEPKHTAATITAKVGELTGTARVRIVPPLPWKFDFSEGEVPVTWVGARYRNVVRKVDGNDVMVKVTTIPKGTRSQSWMGPTDPHDYTIQADVKGSIKDNKMPDIGVIAQRYTLDMMGAHQQLQIRTWPPVLRMAVTIPFKWEPDVWYTMKFRAANENGKAVLRGKVWKKDEAEPKAWTIEATDESPNTIGSPGLFGNAGNAEIFVDNITVTPNS